MQKTEPSYRERQGERDRRYQSEHAKWLASLSADELAKVKEKGLDSDPLSEPAPHSAFSQDAADLPVAAKYQEEVADDPRHEIIRLLTCELMRSRNTRLDVEILAMASGVCWDEGEPVILARKYGLHRAAISARAIEFCDKFHLPPSKAMRSIMARKSAKKARKQSLSKML